MVGVLGDYNICMQYFYRAKLDRVVDGDTVDFNLDLGFDIWHKARVRLNGVNTPESRTRDLEEKKRGLAAKARVAELLSEGTEFVLRTQYDRVGKYGRVIGVIVLSDGEILNEMLVSEGHAERRNYECKSTG